MQANNAIGQQKQHANVEKKKSTATVVLYSCAGRESVIRYTVLTGYKEQIA